MRSLALLLLLLAPSSARADRPAGATRKIVGFVRQTCAFLATDDAMPDTRIADELGTPLGTKDHRLRVAVRALPGWIATIRLHHAIALEPPAGTVLLVSDLERFLGPAKPPEADHGLLERPLPADPHAPEPNEHMTFAAGGPTGLCVVNIETDHAGRKPQNHHVLVLELAD